MTNLYQEVYIKRNFQIWPKTKLSSLQSTVGGWSPIILANCVFFYLFWGGGTFACQSCYSHISKIVWSKSTFCRRRCHRHRQPSLCADWLRGESANQHFCPSSLALRPLHLNHSYWFFIFQWRSAAKSFGRSTISLGQQFHLGAWNHSTGGFF